MGLYVRYGTNFFPDECQNWLPKGCAKFIKITDSKLSINKNINVEKFGVNKIIGY